MRRLTRIRKQNNKSEEHLSLDNLKHYYLILGKLRTLSLNEYHQEQIRQDIIELIWQAQNRGDTVTSVIGSDIEQFVASISESVPRQTKTEQRVINFSIFLNASIYMLIMFILFQIKNNGLTTFTYNVVSLICFLFIFPYVALKCGEYLIEKEWSIKAILTTTLTTVLSILPAIIIKVLNYETLFTVSSPAWLFIGLLLIILLANWKVQKHIDTFYYTEL